jgi:hypothetical protein
MPRSVCSVNLIAPIVALATLVFVVGCSAEVSNGGKSDLSSLGGGPGAGSHGGNGGSSDSRGSAGSGSVATGGSVGTPPETQEPAAPPAAFTCAPGDLGAVPRRLYRLTGEQYKNSLATFFSSRLDAKASTRNPPDGLQMPWEGASSTDRFTTYDTPTMSDFEFRRVFDNAAFLAKKYVIEAKGDGGTCFSSNDKPTSKGCIRELLLQKGSLLFRRPLSTEELDGFAKIANDALPTLGEVDAAAAALQAVFVSPHFVFRPEIGGTPEANGMAKLGAYDVAGALALALTDYPPDAELWAAAQSDQLKTPEQLRNHILRLGKNSAQTKASRRFMREYFRYDGVLQVFKDPNDYRDHDPESLNEETDLLVADWLANNGRKDFFKTVLTSNAGYVKRSNNHDDAVFTYGYAEADLPKNDGTAVKMMLPQNQRQGILTQPSFLVAFSEMKQTKPVQRGRFIRESLLCETIPELPIGQVPPLPDLGPAATMREKLAVHSQKSCWACHQMMDPLGLPFESYDNVGRYRTMDNGKTIDTSGVLEGSGNGDGAYKDALELTRKLANSAVVQQCFVRHAFRYFTGRQEIEGDGCSLVEMNAAYEKSGDLVELLTSYFSSRSFLYRATK